MGPMTALVSTDARTSIEASTTSTGKTSWFSQVLAALARARSKRRMRAELSTLSDALLLDIGVAEDEIFLIRQGSFVTPRAWLERNAATRHLIG